jgi:hypothetical protein
MDRLLFWQLKTAPGKKISTNGDLDFYVIRIDGYKLMYAINREHPTQLRLYVLGNELAKCLGFLDYHDMRARIRLQYWRGMISLKALKRRFR